jgi:hypothetical protein
MINFPVTNDTHSVLNSWGQCWRSVTFWYGQDHTDADLDPKTIRILRIQIRIRMRIRNSGCSARDWDGKDYLRIIPRVVW